MSPGTYDFRIELANQHVTPAIWSRGHKLVGGNDYVHEIQFDAGYLLVHAVSGRGRELNGRETIVRAYPEESRSDPITETMAGVATLLTAGTFNIEITEKYSGANKKLGVIIGAGLTAEPRVVFDRIE